MSVELLYSEISCAEGNSLSLYFEIEFQKKLFYYIKIISLN